MIVIIAVVGGIIETWATTNRTPRVLLKQQHAAIECGVLCLMLLFPHRYIHDDKMLKKLRL